MKRRNVRCSGGGKAKTVWKLEAAGNRYLSATKRGLHPPLSSESVKIQSLVFDKPGDILMSEILDMVGHRISLAQFSLKGLNL